MFDIPAPALNSGKTLDAYLVERAQGIHGCWGRDRPVYVDVHDLDPTLRTTAGAQPIAFVLDQLRQRGSRAVPTTGTIDDRGIDYVRAVKLLLAQYPDGVCIRLAKDELLDPGQLLSALATVLDALASQPAYVDLILDYRYVGRDRPEALRASAREALNTIARFGQFRNIVLAGTSIPDRLGKHDIGKVRRETRVELDAWRQLTAMLAGSMLISAGDYGIVGAHYATPSGVVTVPSRSRYTTETEHVFRRAKRSAHAETCKQVVASQDFLGDAYSAGDHRMSFVARGLAKPGAPANWITDDTTHHIELVSAQVWDILVAQGTANQFNLAPPVRRPWLQTDLIGDSVPGGG